MKETAVFYKPHVKKSAWVGAENFPYAFSESLRSFSRREFPAFKTREEALAWLAKDWMVPGDWRQTDSGKQGMAAPNGHAGYAFVASSQILFPERAFCSVRRDHPTSDPVAVF
jgi:hypothetical protein